MNILKVSLFVGLALLSGCVRIATPKGGIEHTSDVPIAFFDGRFTSRDLAEKDLPHYFGLTGTVIRTGDEDFDFTGIDATLTDPRQRIRTLNGIRFLGAGYTHEINGIAIGGVSNVDIVRGVKLDLIGGNIRGESYGVMVAPLWITAKNTNGLLVSAFNASRDHTGIKVGLINCSRDLCGVEFGLFNVVYLGGWAFFPLIIPLVHFSF